MTPEWNRMFWAQSLENADGDRMFEGSRDLVALADRERVVECVSRVRGNAEIAYSEAGCTIEIPRRSLLVRFRAVLRRTAPAQCVFVVHPEERDEAGRLSPVVCWVRLPEALTAEWFYEVYEDVLCVAARLGRSLSPRTRAGLQSLGIRALSDWSGLAASTGLLRIFERALRSS
jgi:hypothetical protein